MDNNKFLVINTKRFDELREVGDDYTVAKLFNTLYDFQLNYEKKVGKPLNQEYLVCNVDDLMQKK